MLAVRSIASLLVAASAVLVGSLPASAADVDDASVMRVLELTNIERTKVGLPPLTVSIELTAAAQSYSVVLAESGCFAHTCGRVPDFVDRLDQAGYTDLMTAGENIAAGYRTPEAVVEGWMNSAGHRANMLSPKYSEIGIGVATGGGRYGIFWTQDFGTRRFSPFDSSESE